MRSRTRVLSFCLCAAWICALLDVHRASALPFVNRLTPAMQRALIDLPGNRMIRVIVHLVDGRDLVGLRDPSGLLDLQRRTEAAQIALRRWLDDRVAAGSVTAVTPFWIFNGVALSATREVILEMARRPDVAFVELDQVISAPNRAGAQHNEALPGENLIAIDAPSAWGRGFTGKDVVVALLDSGVDMTHIDLAARWRGGSNSWFDPYGEHAEPFDSDGHGTQMLGVILGGDASGTRIGVAPEAQWIAAKIFDDRGQAATTAIHQALQWVLDPDGNPATPDAADVVNNSWSFANMGCSAEFAGDLRALRAAGILPVFAAGLRDPVSPANMPGSLAVGALSASGEVTADSPHGPSACDDARVYPQVVAPGEDILTTDRLGVYATLDGTSLAAAHVSGAVALLLDANPALTADEQEAILTETAVDLGEPGPDNTFGYGRIAAGAMIDRALASAFNPWPLALLAAALLALVLVVRASVRRRSVRTTMSAR